MRFYVAVKMRIPCMKCVEEVACVIRSLVHHLSAPWPIFIVAIGA